MFKFIVESVLNEISAEDAYNKFYNFIDRNIFDEIVAANKGKFDKLARFVMDAIKNKDIGYGDAKSILNHYNQASNDIRIAVKSKFDNGDYDSPIEILEDIDFYKKNGVLTTKSIQNMGFGVIYESDKEKVTYTATYEASQHHYGHTKWCTASDRMGRYDGWIYFLNYVLYEDDMGEIKYDYLNGKLNNPLVTSALIQYINKETNKTYQMQITEHGDVEQVCDENDNSCFLDSTGISDNALDAIKQNLWKIIKITKDCLKKEIQYQLKNENLLEQKKRRRKLKLYDNLMKVFSDKKNLVKKESDKIFSSNLLSNKDFIETMLINYKFVSNGYTNNYFVTAAENTLKEQGYVNIKECLSFKNGFCALLIQPCYGAMKSYDSSLDFTDVFCCDLEYEPFNFYYEDETARDSIFNNFKIEAQSKNFKSAIVIAEADLKSATEDGVRINEIKRIINVFNFDTADIYLKPCINNGIKTGDMAYSFYSDIKTIPNTISYVIENKVFLFSFINGKFFDVTKETNIRQIRENSINFLYNRNDFLMIFNTNDSNKKYGALIDDNLNLKNVFICKRLSLTTEFVLALFDEKNGEIFFMTGSGIKHMGSLNKNGSITTVNYKDKEVFIMKNNGDYEVNIH
jgi:hypothetical protein